MASKVEYERSGTAQIPVSTPKHKPSIWEVFATTACAIVLGLFALVALASCSGI